MFTQHSPLNEIWILKKCWQTPPQAGLSRQDRILNSKSRRSFKFNTSHRDSNSILFIKIKLVKFLNFELGKTSSRLNSAKSSRLNSAKTSSRIELGKTSRLNSAKHHRGLNSAKHHRGLNSEKHHRGLNSAKHHRGLNSAKHHRDFRNRI